MREFEKGGEEKNQKKKKGKTECTCAVEQFEKYEEIKTFFLPIQHMLCLIQYMASTSSS